MMVKYIVNILDTSKIEPIEIEKETDASYWKDGHRRLKDSENERMFDEFDEAKSFLLERAERDVKEKGYELEYAKMRLERIKLIKK